MTQIALTIAGSDPSGGAGLQADLKTFHQHGVYGAGVVTLCTVQNTVRVSRVVPMTGDLVSEQIEAVLSDLNVAAAKTGALGNREVVEAVALALSRSARRLPLVVDPVLISKHGAPLMADADRDALFQLLQLATVVTPNLPELEWLSGRTLSDVESRVEAARSLIRGGVESVLVKGGHAGDDQAVDIWVSGDRVVSYSSPRVATKHTHGTGCTLSAAITARLALGDSVEEAIGAAKQYLTRALQTATPVGSGISPVNHFAPAVQPRPIG